MPHQAAIILGASGSVGSALLDEVERSARFSPVIVVVRYDDYREMPGGKHLPYRIEGDYDGTYLVIQLQAISLAELPESLFGDPGRD
ncbi:MAG: hypothetical protein R2834_21660 [Rhodothermales bacterium]